MKKKSLSIGSLLLLLTGIQLQAQPVPISISLEDAVQMGIKNNLELRATKLEIAWAAAVVKTATDIPKTAILADYGQVNSIKNDTRIGINQVISWPKVYSSQKESYAANQQIRQTNYARYELLLKTDIKRLYYSWLVLHAKEKLLQEADSIYAVFLSKAELRFQKGATNILEKTSAQTQRNQVKLQLQQVINDKQVTLNQLNQLLNAPSAIQPVQGALQYPFIPVMDTSVVYKTPFAAIYRKKTDAALADWRLEKAKLSPELSMGYSNMSIIGIQNINGVDVNFTGSRRFSTVSAGVNVPLFNSARKNKIQAARINWQITQLQGEAFNKQLQTQYRNAFEQYRKNQEAARYYENTALNDAKLIIATAEKQFASGEINFLEWTLLVNQSINIRNGYLDVLQQLNENRIQLEMYNQ
jgi:heavy metal efflux system protein